MKHYFLDTNVLIDYLAQRQPFWADAAELMQAGVDKQAVLYVASLSFNNIYYILRRQITPNQARLLLAALEKMVTIVAVDAEGVRQAINGPFADVEDGMQHYAAVSVATIEALITRDLRDFKSSRLPILTPAQALAALPRS